MLNAHGFCLIMNKNKRFIQMKQILSFCSVFLIMAAADAQIIAPDTVCAGDTVILTTPVQGRIFTWNLDTVNITLSPPPSTTVLQGPPLNTPTYATMNEDNGNWYSFVSNAIIREILRLDYGNSPYNTPVATSLGGFGLAPAGTAGAGHLQGIEILQDSATGNWYGFAVCASQLLRLDFGNSLANTPASTLMSFSSFFAYPLQIGIRRFNNDWIGFVGSQNGSITRLEFGSSLVNTPVAQNLGVSNFNLPTNFALYEQNGLWYMLIANLINPAGLTRLEFGASLLNNNPAGVRLTTPAGRLPRPRGMFLISNCDQLYAYVVNEGPPTAPQFGPPELELIDFNNDITNNAPTVTLLGNYNLSNNSLRPYIFNGDLNALLVSNSGAGGSGSVNVNTISNLRLFSFPAGSVSVNSYNNPDISHVFTVPGTYDITLFVDQGAIMGPSSFCKRITVITGQSGFLGNDTTACTGETYILDAAGTGATDYLWNTGAVTPEIPVTQPGTYWVQLTGSLCYSADTVTVSFDPLPVDIGPDRVACLGDTVTLQAAGVYNNPVYQWSTGLGTSSINVTRPDMYWLRITEPGGCTGSDTVHVKMIPPPLISIGDDTIICASTPLRIGMAYPGATYLWNTGETDAYTEVSSTGDYILSVSVESCTVSDTIMITAMPDPDIDLGPDDDICPEQVIILDASAPGNNRYVWNTGDTTDSVSVSAGGLYQVEVTSEYGCSSSDSIMLRHYPEPVVMLGNDTTVCEETPLQLSAWTLNTDSVLWSDGTTGNPLSVKSGGTYIATAINKCGTQSDTIVVKQIFCDIMLPNAFTPNGDGMNDIFRILGNTGRMEGVSFGIYNRWGEQVFHTKDKYQGWDGYYKNRPSLMGTYVYLLEYSVDGRPYLQKGNFHLLR